MSALECVRETLAVALDELEEKLTQGQRPEFWEQLWERYVESKLDYKSAEETLQSKRPRAFWPTFLLRPIRGAFRKEDLRDAAEKAQNFIVSRCFRHDSLVKI